MGDDFGGNTPESGLVEIFETARGRLPERGNPARRIAVAWLTELYGTVRAWNEEFIRFLKRYPGFRASTDPQDYKAFLVELNAYRVALDERSPQVKRALCDKLHRLYDRFERDFAPIARDDPAAYDRLHRIVDDAYRGEDRIILDAGNMIWEVTRSFEVDYFGPREQVALHAPLHDWHVAHHDTVCRLILGYEASSARAVERLGQLAEEAGLDFTGLEDFAAHYAPAPQIVVQGNVTTTTVHGDYNRNEGGVQIVGSTTGPISFIQSRDPTLGAALDEIGSYVRSTGNAAAEAMHASLVDEAAKPKPEPSRLKQFWDGLVGLAPGVKALSGAAAAVMALFV